MSPRGGERAALKRILPRRLRLEFNQVRRLGPTGYTRLQWRRARAERIELSANFPFDIGASVPIVLHESTLPGVRSHFVDRGRGTPELDAFKRLAVHHSTFLDIGAGAGIFSAAFCALTGRKAYALEPSPEMWTRISGLIELNPSLAIEPFNIALGAATGTQPVSVHGAQFRGEPGTDAHAQTMVVQDLDGFVAEHGLDPDFAKVDVEGMELEVLRGGADTFKESVDALMLEVHPRLLLGGRSVADVQAQLIDFGFDLFTLTFEPIDDLTRHLAANPRRARAANVVCLKSAPPPAAT